MRTDPQKLFGKLTTKTGKEYWRSLDELANTPQFQELLEREYPRYAAVLDTGISRRQFLKLLGASLALAGLTACGVPPAEKIVPYVRQPSQFVPGKPLYYATAMTLNGYARGLLVENHLGRPIKVEGNPDHPDSLGATDIFAQASILSLYDPDRSQVITHRGQIDTWEKFFCELANAVDAQKARQGAGLAILTETVTSPTLADQLRTLLKNFPSAKWYQYDPAARDNAYAGSQLAFGQAVETNYHIDKADVIVSLDSDFLLAAPGSLRYARDFAARRRLEGQATMNRLYVVESTPTITGAKADHRLGLRASDVEFFARALAMNVGVRNLTFETMPPTIPANWVTALAKDLQQHRGSSLVMAGDVQPPIVHALAHALNNALGNVGATITYTDPIAANPTNTLNSLRGLVGDLNDNRVELMLILGSNPIYNAPADLKFDEALAKAKLRIHLGEYEDETAALCDWHIPQAHYLETWSDTRAYDGTVSIVQPLIAPLYGGKSTHELLAALGDNPTLSGYEIVQNYWKSQHPGSDFDTFWNKALNDGIVPNTNARTRTPTLRTDWTNQTNRTASNNFEITFRPDPSIYDGRFANNGWLQELPKPLTRLTWDNVALVSPATAQRLDLRYELASAGGTVRTDVIELNYQGRMLRAPIWITPGQPDDSITVFLGYGRTRAGKVGTGIGYNAYAIRTSNAPWIGTGLEIRKTGERFELASVQQHTLVEGRGLIQAATLDEFQKNPNFAHESKAPKQSLYPEYKSEGYAWGMAIDLNSCIGCNACVVACQSENNIPIVGKDQVLKAREMHWLRIDTYHAGDANNPETFFEPVPCMQCENAPCELVCPVAATVHSSEGLNDMVYNRCVGTRYCSNNCPYKVRRFNFLQFADWDTSSLKAMRNPDVTVRSRGVMEKCTYCVQRINHARITAENEGRTIRDGEVITACAAACSADAIVFGDINDKNSRVAKLKASSRNYALLEELNTRPRTTYLAAVRNPNPEIG
ncbi:MAG: TAT-variant-translocated molybdopterin oxidoreductase [Chloroflexi bacterium]|nr:TAT-variant-translocated molybdopterin oxidoreductase [Chloroflexota bacterium]